MTFRTILKCLNEANKRHVTSIAFPTEGRGLNTYPPDVVARTYTQCISHFETSHRHTRLTIKDVYLVSGGGNPELGVQVIKLFYLVTFFFG